MSITTGNQVTEVIRALRDNLESVVQGKADVIDRLIITTLAGGSVLLEDVPGVGKTTLAER